MESKVTRRQSHALLIEVLDEALRLLPPTVPTFTKLKIYDEPIPNIRRRKRVDANGLQTRRSKAFNPKP
jgi:valyl-tRNA synthetase